MDNAYTDEMHVSFSSESRSGRWSDLRTYLKQLILTLDENSDRLAHLQSEMEAIRADNLRIAEMVQGLSDAANEEVQREISLTLNDDDSDVVIDVAPDEMEDPEAPTDDEILLSVEDFISELKKLPGIGAKSSETIANYIAEAQGENVLKFAYALRAVNDDLSKGDDSRQPTLDLG